MKIAVAGKGGVGKTLVASGISWALARSGHTTIAIDADPTPNLAISLGIPEKDAAAIVPVSENNALIRKKTGTGFPGVYNLNFSVDDVVRDFSVATPTGVHLLIMGTVKSMGAGCTCPANSVIRTLLRHLVIERDEAVVLDMEAGIEHLGRGTAEGVDVMLVVTDANKKSLDVAGTIGRMALDSGIPRVEIAGNRIASADERKTIERFALEHGMPVIGFIPYDPDVFSAGIRGEPVTVLQGTAALRSIEKITAQIPRIIGGKIPDPKRSVCT
jgi:CO dehydrogenase maturation factor